MFQSGTGKITPAELQEVCFQFNLVVDETLLTQLMNYCDVDGNGMLNYEEFVNFLNWKDKMRASPPGKGAPRMRVEYLFVCLMSACLQRFLSP